MCRLLGVSSSGFYDWLGRPVSAHERENAQLLKAIKHSHEASDGTYGSPRVVRDIIDAGFACSENRIARLMKAVGIKARHKRRRAPGQLASPVHAIAPNLLDRQFEATRPNQKWAADFTHVWTGEGWLAVCRCRPRPVLTACGGLVDATDDDGAVSDGCPVDGRLPPWPTSRSIASLGPGIAIHQRSLPAPARFSRHRLQHEPSRQLLGHSVYDELERLPNLTRAGIGLLPLR